MYRVLLCGMLFFAALIAGCGGFFSQKSAEVQTQVLLNELRQVPENPNIRNPLPELYRKPPMRMGVKDGVKVFYFTRHQPPTKLAELVRNQFADMTTDGKGNTIYAPHYKIVDNPATNQLIFECPADEEADKIIDFLEKVDVPPIQVNIDCLILERFADVTMDWETSVEVENFLGEEITLEGVFPGASLRESARADLGLDIGYWRNQGIEGHQFRVLIDMLVSRGYLKILMNPVLETTNGQPATIRSRENVPLEKIYLKPGFDEPFSLTEYQWVEDSLEVTPYVYADGTIGLKTKAQIGSKSKPEGVVQLSIITERAVDVAENRLAPGDSLVIGGIRKTEERVVVRGVPFFKDLPLIGILFSSKDFEEKSNEVIFILTPSISSGGRPAEAVANEVRNKFAPPEYKLGLQERLTDPFGAGSYTSAIEQKAAQAEFERFKAEIERTEALEELSTVKTRLIQSAEEVLAEKQKVAHATAEAKAAQAEAEQLKKQAEQANAEARAAQQQAQTAQQQAEALKAQAEKAQAEAEQAKKQATEQAKQLKAEAQKAQAEAQAAQQKADQATAEAQAAQQQAQQAKKQAESARKQAEQLKAEKQKSQQDSQAQPAPANEQDPNTNG